MRTKSAVVVFASSFFIGACGPALAAGDSPGAKKDAAGDLALIDTVVVIYAENRSFDNLYGSFPGANGVAKASASTRIQRDRDGKRFRELPPIWEGLTAKGVTPPITQAETEHLPNRPFYADDPKGFRLSYGTITRDLWHRFYQNQMQINGGRNDKFVAHADSGALVMSLWDGSKLAMWKVAEKYVLADNFFMGAFGGSFLNHQWLVCACVPYYPRADTNPAKPSISVVERDGVTLTQAANSPKSAMDGIPKYAGDGNLTPDFYAVNTMQPPYQPSGNDPAKDGDKAYADPKNATTLVPQIGALAHASRPSSSLRMRAAVMSTIRRWTRHRSCASSRAASNCRRCTASPCATLRSPLVVRSRSAT